MSLNMRSMDGPHQLQKFYIRSLLRLADHECRDLVAPFTNPECNQLRSYVARSVATVEEVLGRNQHGLRDLAGPTRAHEIAGWERRSMAYEPETLQLRSHSIKL